MTTSITDVLLTPAAFAIFRAMADNDDTIGAQNLRQTCRAARDPWDMNLRTTMHIACKGYKECDAYKVIKDPKKYKASKTSKVSKKASKIKTLIVDLPRFRYPRDAPAPRRIRWESLAKANADAWRFNETSDWLDGVEEMWGDGPGMLALLTDHYGSIPLGGLRRLVARVSEMDYMIIPRLLELCLHVNAMDILESYGTWGHSSFRLPMSNLESLEIVVGDIDMLDGQEYNPIDVVPYLIRQARRTLKRLTLTDQSLDRRGFDVIMEAVSECSELEFFEISCLESDAVFVPDYARMLPKRMRKVLLGKVVPTPLAYVPPGDANGYFTYYIDVKEIAVQCENLETVMHTGIEPVMDEMAPRWPHLDRRMPGGCACINCGCSREFDIYDTGDRICWCDLCSAVGCVYVSKDHPEDVSEPCVYYTDI